MKPRRQLTTHDFMVLLWSAPDWMSAKQLRAVVLKAIGKPERTAK